MEFSFYKLTLFCKMHNTWEGKILSTNVGSSVLHKSSKINDTIKI